MRLTILTQYFVPEMGAPQSRLYELARELRRQGWDVNVVTAMPNYPTGKIFPAYRGRFSAVDTVEGMTVFRYWLYASNAPRAFSRIVSMLSFSFFALFSWLRIRRYKPDFLFVESPPLTLACSGWLLARLTGSRFVMNVSDLWPLSARELGAMSDGWLYRRLEALEAVLYRHADVCTGQSEEITRYVQLRGARKAWLFRNGVDVSRFPSTTFDPARRRCLIYAGLLGVAQGILALCQNIPFRELGVEFHVYGSGAEGKAIEAFVREHPDSGVRWMGVADRESIPALLSSYGGALIPLVRDIHGAVPSKIYEAMAASLPILFSGSGEGARIISEYRAGWTNQPMDWNGLTENIRAFASLETHDFEAQRRHNRMVAETHFDRARQIQTLGDNLKQLVS